MNFSQAFSRLKTGMCSIVVPGALAVAAAFTPGVSVSQTTSTWPDRPITLLVPVGAGGGADIISRTIADRLSKVLGAPIVVRNQPGANGTVGTMAVARAPADGYTILVGTIGTHAANTCLYNLPYDAEKDFSPVALIAQYNNVLIVRNDSPIKSLEDLIERAKAEPGKLTYAISVVGATSHLGVEKLKYAAGIKLLGVPYNGVAPATIDLLAGRVDFMVDTVASQFGNLSAGKVRGLGTTSIAGRSPILPNVKTVAEHGLANFNVVGWAGFFVRSGTPEPIIQKIADGLKKVYDTGEIQQLLGSKGMDVITNTPKEFANFVAKDREMWCDVIRAQNIKVQ